MEGRAQPSGGVGGAGQTSLTGCVPHDLGMSPSPGILTGDTQQGQPCVHSERGGEGRLGPRGWP